MSAKSDHPHKVVFVTSHMSHYNHVTTVGSLRQIIAGHITTHLLKRYVTSHHITSPQVRHILRRTSCKQQALMSCHITTIPSGHINTSTPRHISAARRHVFTSTFSNVSSCASSCISTSRPAESRPYKSVMSHHHHVTITVTATLLQAGCHIHTGKKEIIITTRPRYTTTHVSQQPRHVTSRHNLVMSSEEQQFV